MSKSRGYRFLALLIVVVLCLVPAARAAGTPDYTTTYTITLKDNGTALWNVEYRTPLTSDADTSNFENYTRDLNSVYLPEIESLMKSSAAQAGAGTSRQMTVENFSGSTDIQTTPTGEFGVVTFSFYWTNFAVPDGGITVGDAFTGGLYLSQDNNLIIQYPDGYTVRTAEPAPDQQGNNALVWYGVRSFGAGEPSIILEKTALPLVPIIAGCIVIILAVVGLILYQRKKRDPPPPSYPSGKPEDASPPLSDADSISYEDRILQQLRAHGGEQFQSDLAKVLGIPKSSLSSTLNDLHQRGIIVKVKKGKENLIRLADEHQ